MKCNLVRIEKEEEDEKTELIPILFNKSWTWKCF